MNAEVMAGLSACATIHWSLLAALLAKAGRLETVPGQLAVCAELVVLCAARASRLGLPGTGTRRARRTSSQCGDESLQFSQLRLEGLHFFLLSYFRGIGCGSSA
eukprot:1638349-Rhodomonas_salina.1